MALICVTLTGIAWLTQSLRFIDLIVNRGLNIGTFFYLSSLLLPSLLWIIVPVSLFISVLVAFNKLMMDSELIVLRNAGINRLGLVKPALYFAAGITLLSYAIGLYLLPASYREFKDMQTFIRDNYASLLLQEGVFVSPIRGWTVYTRERDEDGILHGVIAHDSRTPEKTTTYIAESGMPQKATSGLQIVLENGNIQQVNHKNNELTFVHFERYVMELSLFDNPLTRQRWREPQERYISELLHPDDSSPAYQQKLTAEAHHRLTWPLFNLLLVLIALLPSISAPYNRRGNNRYMMVCIAIGIGLIIWGMMLSGILAKNPGLVALPYITIVLVAGLVTYYLLGERNVRDLLPWWDRWYNRIRKAGH